MKQISQIPTTSSGLWLIKCLTIRMALLLMLLTSTASAEVILKLDETEITGARELPKVLYIVPWKKALPDPRPLPMRSLMDEILTPIDIDVFRRQVRYHEMTQTSPESDSPAPQ
ncbi:MAG: hypothetical protein COB30_013090 [Ectothiorhodospiraceae bacterium]|nr:hypothetical protein [Ectothiorhodospiraceae bacterium]